MLRTLLLTLVLLLVLVPVMADEQFSIVTPQWAADHSGNADLRILDVRQDPHDYFAGHVPNAVHLADNTLRGTKNGVPVQYLPVDTLAVLLSRVGIRPNDRVLVYSDGAGVLGATMTAYVLEKLGHKNIMIMDGGWSVYKAAGLPVSQKYPKYEVRSLTGGDDKSIYVTVDQIRGYLGDAGIKFVDARPPKVYAGEVTIWQRNGHIPGAVNSDWHLFVDTDNPHKLKSIAEMQAVLDSKGIRKSDNIIVYCGTSREASLEYAVMRHILGYPNLRLYEGSWTEYSGTDLPVETGMR